MAYMLLSSQIPFCGNNMKEIARKIMFSDHSFSGKRWSKISQEGKDFVSSLMVRDVTSRPTADHALKHPWVAGGKPSFNSKTLSRRHSSGSIGGTAHTSSERQLQKPLDDEICTSIENYSTYSWMVRNMLPVWSFCLPLPIQTQMIHFNISASTGINGDSIQIHRRGNN